MVTMQVVTEPTRTLLAMGAKKPLGNAERHGSEDHTQHDEDHGAKMMSSAVPLLFHDAHALGGTKKVKAKVKCIRTDGSGVALHGMGARKAAVVLHLNHHELGDLGKAAVLKVGEVLYEADASVGGVSDGLRAVGRQRGIAGSVEASQGCRGILDNLLADGVQISEVRVHALYNVLHVLHIGNSEGTEAEEVFLAQTGTVRPRARWSRPRRSRMRARPGARRHHHLTLELAMPLLAIGSGAADAYKAKQGNLAMGVHNKVSGVQATKMQGRAA